MSLRTTLLSGTRFAHLAGITASQPAANPAADDDETMAAQLAAAEQRAQEAESRAQAAEERAQQAEADLQAALAKASRDPDGDDDDDSSDEGDDDDDRTDMAAARGKRVVKARNRENARCAAIFACPAAARNPALAAELAFGTERLSRTAAIKMLTAATPPRAGLDERMAAIVQPPVTSDPPNTQASGPAAAAQRVIDTYNMIKGVKKD